MRTPQSGLSTEATVDSVHPTLPRWVAGSEHGRSIPEAIGRYRVGERLGQGGVGTVHAGHDDGLGRDVAIKFVPCAPGSKTATRVLREARALARLSHPGVVHVYDYGRLDGSVYIVMELVEGQTLQRWLETASPWRTRLSLYAAIGRGLSAAHAAGIVHRDFKPSNVVVDPEGRPHILDFGLARIDAEADLPRDGSPQKARTEEGLTREGDVMGTPRFMSPEQWRGEEVDARTDQFSFCVSLFQALLGEWPYTPEALMTAEPGRAPAIAGVASSAVPGGVRRALERGLAFTPDERWPSMDALLDELLRPLQRRKWAWAVGGAAVVALGLGGLWMNREDLEARCAAARGGLAWTDAERAPVRESFDATGLGYAGGTFAFVDRRLGGFADAWVEASEVTCLERARGESTTRQHADRQACLDEHRVRFRQTLGVLAEVDAKTLANAPEAARGLPDPSRCRDASTAAEVDEAVRDAVARADVLRRAARLEEALATLTEVMGEDVSPAVALRVRGLVHEDRGEYEDAAADLQRAYRAAEAEAQDELAARAAIELVRVLGYRLARHDEAGAFGVTAEAKLARIATEHDRLAADLAGARGRLALSRGDGPDALESLTRATGLREELGGDALGLAADLNKRAQALSDLGRDEEAAADLMRALELRREALGPTHPLVGSNRLNLGHVAAARGQAEVAFGHFEAAVTILESSLGGAHPQTAAALSGLSTALMQAGRVEEAHAASGRAIAAYDAAGVRKTAAQVRLNLATRMQESDPDAAAALVERARDDLHEAVGEEHPLSAQAMYQLARARRQQGRLEEALAEARRSAEVRQALRGPDDLGVLEAQGLVGQLLGQLGRPEDIAPVLARWFQSPPPRDVTARHAFAAITYAQGLYFTGREPEALAVVDAWLGPLQAALPDNKSVKALAILSKRWRDE